jgi:peptidoglycan hydrolase FlgJ
MNVGQLHNSLSGQSPMSPDNPKLKSAAHEFEASLMQELLKPLQRDSLFVPGKSDGSDPSGNTGDDSDDDQGSSGALMSFGAEAMAKAISERGGFGIATQILDRFRTQTKTANSANSTKV